jgi:hypothetical protein
MGSLDPSAQRIAVLPGVFRNHPPLAAPGVAPTLHFVMVGIITAAGPVPPEVPGDYDMLRATFQVVHGFHFPHLKAGPLSFYVGRAVFLLNNF